MRSSRLDLAHVMNRAVELILDIHPLNTRDHTPTHETVRHRRKTTPTPTGSAQVSERSAKQMQPINGSDEGALDMSKWDFAKTVRMANELLRFRESVKQNPDNFTEWQRESLKLRSKTVSLRERVGGT
jgi:hypothetical protein